MAASPRWKVYDAAGRYQAACHEVEAAAALMGLYGSGATIRDGHRAAATVWTEGVDGAGADSYDRVARVAWERVNARRAAFGLAPL